MIRRAFCSSIRVGSFPLTAAEAHHLRDVLRAGLGQKVELFDADGKTAAAVIERSDVNGVVVRVDAIGEPPAAAAQLTVATAVPKADRADWLVEKLSEIGVTRWVPLKTARSVVHPAGNSKWDRWRRIAVEAAKQSRRPGVMEITATMMGIEHLPMNWLTPRGGAVVLSTGPGCVPFASIIRETKPTLLLIGPEGGWTAAELGSACRTRGQRGVADDDRLAYRNRCRHRGGHRSSCPAPA